MLIRDKNFCFQNFVMKHDLSGPGGFGYIRLLFLDLTIREELYNIFQDQNIKIMSEICTAIECDNAWNVEKIKYQGIFFVNSIDQVNNLINNLFEFATANSDRIQFPSGSNREDLMKDILYISDRFGCSHEDFFIGFDNVKSRPNQFILVGGLWDVIIKAMRDNTGDELTEDMLRWIGSEQGEHVASYRAKIILGDMDKVISCQKEPQNQWEKILRGIKIKVDQKEPDFDKINKIFFQSYGYGTINNFKLDVPGNKVISIDMKQSFFFRKDKSCSFLEGYFNAYFKTLLGTDHNFEDKGPYGEQLKSRKFESISD